MFNLNQLKLLNPVNRKYLEAYSRHLSLAQLKDKTIYTKMWKIYAFFKFHCFQDTKQITNIASEDYVIYRRKHFSPITVNQDITELNLYFRWLLPGKEQELFGNIKQQRIKPNLPVDQLITREDIQ